MEIALPGRRKHAESTGDPAIAENFIETMGPAWAKRDLASALDWTLTHLKGKSRMEQSSELFEAAAGEDFDAALRVWQTLPAGTLQLRAAKALTKGARDDRKTEADAILQSLRE